MKGRGTRLCGDVNKRYFTIFDYSGASALEDAEFDGHPTHKGGRAAVILPEGVLTQDNANQKVRKELLEQFKVFL